MSEELSHAPEAAPAESVLSRAFDIHPVAAAAPSENAPAPAADAAPAAAPAAQPGGQTGGQGGQASGHRPSRQGKPGDGKSGQRRNHQPRGSRPPRQGEGKPGEGKPADAKAGQRPARNQQAKRGDQMAYRPDQVLQRLHGRPGVFRAYVHEAEALLYQIRLVGLGPSLAVLLSQTEHKSKRRIYWDISKWIFKEQRIKGKNVRSLMESIVYGDPRFLLKATHSVVNFLEELVKLSQDPAHQPGPATAPSATQAKPAAQAEAVPTDAAPTDAAAEAPAAEPAVTRDEASAADAPSEPSQSPSEPARADAPEDSQTPAEDAQVRSDEQP